MKVRLTEDGRAYLHMWRTGGVYERQNGPRFQKEWTNVKFTVLPYLSSAQINFYDLRKPLLFSDNTFDAIYTFHIFEHLTPKEAQEFMAELYRVLKPGSICRISTPDLEMVCREYLKALEEAAQSPTSRNLTIHRWAVMEIFEQMVRDKSGGLMLEAIQQGNYDRDYIHERYGDIFDEFLEYPNNRAQQSFKRVSGLSPKGLLYALLRKLRLALWNGSPRRTREANRWLYDRLSLQQLFESHGFKQVAVKGHAESDIAGWSRFNFDQSAQGDYPLEPSLYMEGRKV